MNRTTRIISWALAAAGYLVTLCFMQREDVFYSRVAVSAAYLLGALVPFVLVAVAARLAAAQGVAISIMVTSGLLALGGTALYWYYFAVVRDDYAGLLFIIVPT